MSLMIMKVKKMRVFHGLMNFGTQSGILAKGLREQGVNARSYTKADKYFRQTDVHLKQRKTLLSKAFYYKIWYPLIKLFCFFRYNIFHFYFGQSLLKSQLDLPLYKIFGKKVVMHYLGNDVELYNWSRKNYKITNMTETYNEETGPLHDAKVLSRMAYESKFIDKKLICAPQYAPFVEGAEFIPLGIDLQNFEYCEIPDLELNPLRIVHAPTNRRKKGTKYLLDAVNRLKEENYDVELDICERITHDELLKRYKNAHVSVVALLGGWYGTAAVEAMALGRPVITFIRPSLFQYTKWNEDDLPIINANKNTIYKVLKETLENKENLKWLSSESREYVEKVHDYRNVCKQLKNIYRSL